MSRVLFLFFSEQVFINRKVLEKGGQKEKGVDWKDVDWVSH